MNITMEELVRMVRKHGEIKVSDKAQASNLVAYAKEHHGYTFKSRILGWSHIVEDADI